jgi:plasmid stabilization system protein ParE
MTRPVRLDPLAEAELQDAIAWYDDEQPGLGMRFWDAVDGALEKLSTSPVVASTPVPDMPADVPARRVFIPPFPYQVVFVEWRDECRVVAIAHFAREPRYWLGRL